MSVSQNIERLKQHIQKYAHNCGRDPALVTLVAVSKFQSAERIEEAYACGLRDFGENYTQEWKSKAQQLAHLPDLRWHLIGHLQKNKVKDLNANLFCLQSLDSLSLAKEIEKKWNVTRKLPVLVQLQIDARDTNKSGIESAQARELCTFLMESKTLDWRGFMGVGPARQPHTLKALYERFFETGQMLWQEQHVHNQSNQCIFSLGMSEDIETAIACGSTMVRIGRSIFGKRPTSR